LVQLDLITGIIDGDSRGHRTPAFSAWWNGQHPLKDALHELRNAELKRREQRTGLNAVVQVETVRAVIEDGKLRNLPPDPNSQLPRGRIYWTFTSGDFAGQEVLPTLRHYYDHLLKNVIPTAAVMVSVPDVSPMLPNDRPMSGSLSRACGTARFCRMRSPKSFLVSYSMSEVGPPRFMTKSLLGNWSIPSWPRSALGPCRNALT
jgi:hypothetical protein